MTEYALRLTNGADTAPRVRFADGLGLLPAASLKVRSGVRNDAGGAVTVNAGTMGVSVSPFVAFAQGGSSTGQGGYVFVLDAAKTLTLTDGHASLARVDTIAVVVKEDAFDGSGSTSASVQVVTGTAGAGAPTLPATAIPLRDVNVPAGLSVGTGGLASGNLSTDRRGYLPAGVTRIASATERNTLTPQPGFTIYRTDTKVLECYNGSGWDVFTPHTDTGWSNITVGGAWTAGTPVPQYRTRDGVVFLRGRVSRASGSNATAGTIPTAGRPVSDLTVLVRSANSPVQLTIGANGVLTVGGAYVNGDAVILESVPSYLID